MFNNKIITLFCILLCLFPYISEAASTASCYDSDSVLMMHMDGSNASTTFTDSSNSAHSFTAHGSAQITTGNSKFGGASGQFFLATTDYADTPDSLNWNFGSNNFTIDFWVKLRATGNTTHWLGQSDSGFATPALDCYDDNADKMNCRVFSSGGTQYQITSTTAMSTSIFKHIALVRNGNNLNLYINGTAEGGTTDVTGVTMRDNANKFAVGRLGEFTSNTMDGYVDELRIVNGTAVWTANFTSPSSAYTACTASSSRSLIGVGQ